MQLTSALDLFSLPDIMDLVLKFATQIRELVIEKFQEERI